jgi:AraC-like DNA-binding protein
VDLVVAACRAIESDPTRRESVAGRARDLGLTSTRLTHAFRRYLGISPHQYVIRHRLAASAALLDEGSSVSDSCWRSGFENLSHFCRSFQLAFGVRPSAWTRQSLPEKRRKVQAFLGRTR